MRDICNSQTYQRSSQRNASNETDERNFAHARIRRIPAESLLDCISQVTETKDKFQGLPLGARAVQIADGSASNVLPDHVRPLAAATRSAPCEVTTEPTLSQALHLLNGDTVDGKIRDGGVVQETARRGKHAAAGDRDDLHPLPVPQAERRRRSTSCWRVVADGREPASRAWTTSSGPC